MKKNKYPSKTMGFIKRQIFNYQFMRSMGQGPLRSVINVFKWFLGLSVKFRKDDGIKKR